MNIDVAKAIKELLFTNDAVILPGLGGFTSSPVSAVVDYVQGSVQPPSKKLEFNPNLVINDGILVNHIQSSEVITAQEATVAIDNYVAGIKESLEQREIVDIPEVGRLYKDYEQKVRFMPDNTNFEIGSFGLPPVQFNPIVRQKNQGNAETTPVRKARPSDPLPVSPIVVEDKGWAEKALPWLIAVAAVLLAFSLFMWLNDSTSEQQADVPQARVNVKPTQENTASESGSDTNTDNIMTEDETTNTNQDQAGSHQNDTEEDTPGRPSNSTTPDESINSIPPSSQNEVKNIFVVIHSFGSANNARKFARELENAGYTPTTKERGGLKRVGVEVPETRANEIDELIKELGRKFKSSPVAVDY
ncbi:MAG: hypothetical protein AAFZ15_19585 [Bacteroidota bacterium]